MTRVFDIEIYRDGGSVEFRVDNDGKLTHVLLDTPFRGEPRALRIDSVSVSRGDPQIVQLLENIDRWWLALPQALQMKIEEALSHKGPFLSPDEATSQAIDHSRVISVRNYIKKNYEA